MSLLTMQKLEMLQRKCDNVYPFVLWFSYKKNIS
jgi:hypothetical protein